MEHIFDVLRSELTKNIEVYGRVFDAKKEDLALSVNNALGSTMTQYDFRILQVLL